MHKKTILALGGATLALAIASPVALGAGTAVTVRVEGKTRTLLATKSIHTHGGFITRNGAPVGRVFSKQRRRRARRRHQASLGGVVVDQLQRLPDLEDPRRHRDELEVLLGHLDQQPVRDQWCLRPEAAPRRPAAVRGRLGRPSRAPARDPGSQAGRRGQVVHGQGRFVQRQGQEPARSAREPRGSRPGRRHQQPRHRARRGRARPARSSWAPSATGFVRAARFACT